MKDRIQPMDVDNDCDTDNEEYQAGLSKCKRELITGLKNELTSESQHMMLVRKAFIRSGSQLRGRPIQRAMMLQKVDLAVKERSKGSSGASGSRSKSLGRFAIAKIVHLRN